MLLGRPHPGPGASPRSQLCDLSVAEPEADKAIEILRIALARPNDEYEDLGRVTDALLNALRLQPGQFART